METVNALTIRNHLGEVLSRLEQTGKPIFVSRGRQVRAVLITPEDFEKRFVDVQTEEEKNRRLAAIHALREKSRTKEKSLDVLRELRGYGK